MTRDGLGRPLRDFRISVTDKCNLRCPYCMPADQCYSFFKQSQVLSYEETVRIAKCFAQLGTTKIRVTGGEPLLRKDLWILIQELVAIEGIQDVGLTTNGVLLKGQAQSLWDAGLRRITVSLDSRQPETYRKLTGRDGSIEHVYQGLKAAKSLGFDPIKINTVLMRHINDSEIVDLVTWAKREGFEIRFIEFMDVGNLNSWSPDVVVSGSEVLQRLQPHFNFEAIQEPLTGKVANNYRFVDGGKFGLINSVSQPFCGGCSRARINASGTLYGCLFASKGLDLKGFIRSGCSDQELLRTIKSFWSQRENRYSELRSEGYLGDEKVEMFQVGG